MKVGGKVCIFVDMILTFLHSVEFHVICIVVAAAIISLFIRPAKHGEVVQHLLAMHLSADGNDTPSIELTVNEDLTVTLVRYGLTGVCSDGAVSLVVTVVGTDITIEERITAGHYQLEPMQSATVSLDFLRPKLYHLRYNGENGGTLFAATPLRIRPGIHIVRPLTF